MSDELRDERLEKLRRLREDGVAAYPERFETTHTIAAARELEVGTGGVRVAGRLVLKRVMGKLTFATLQSNGGRIQISLTRDELAEDVEASKALYKRFQKLVDLWDHVGVEGELYLTKKEELTIKVASYTFLGKALQPPPSKYQGQTDVEQNWRKRYVDLISNPETFDRFRFRSRLVRALRRGLDEAAFDEVETPVLCNQASGALARPFKSHHNSLDMEVVLRIAPETYLKRLIVGGYERVYEFARCFRNEGMDPSHLQDFTMLEFYAAYWNYEDNMRFTERLLKSTIQEALGTLKVQRGERTIDFGGRLAAAELGGADPRAQRDRHPRLRRRRGAAGGDPQPRDRAGEPGGRAGELDRSALQAHGAAEADPADVHRAASDRPQPLGAALGRGRAGGGSVPAGGRHVGGPQRVLGAGRPLGPARAAGGAGAAAHGGGTTRPCRWTRTT